MATKARHGEVSNRLLDQADEEFEKGDALQASEKAWGAVAHYVKSAAEVRGWPDGLHRDMADNARKLLDLTPYPDGNRGKFALINILHVNFYEEDLDPRDERGTRHAPRADRRHAGSGAWWVVKKPRDGMERSPSVIRPYKGDRTCS